VVAPVAAVPPVGQGAHQHQDQDDQKQGTHGSPFGGTPTSLNSACWNSKPLATSPGRRRGRAAVALRLRRVGYGAGWVTVLLRMLTAVWDSSRPLTDPAVPTLITVMARTIPSKCEASPIVSPAPPAICQKTFLARAPPTRLTDFAPAMVTSPAIWKIQTSLAAPERVRSVGMVTPVPHL